MVNQRQRSSKRRNREKLRARTTPSRANARDSTIGILGMPTSWPGSSAIAPGRAYVRMVTEVFPTSDARFFSKTGFSTWSSQLDGILSPYKFFRIASATAEVIVSGGAASTYTVAFNISNASQSDTGTAAVLNDDYSGVSTALIRPTLRPPKAYWDQRSIPWFTYLSSTDSHYNPATAVAGAIALQGSGSSVVSDIIGYLVSDIVVEFHTLV
nr:hypothetical protein [Tolivirales sp.]